MNSEYGTNEPRGLEVEGSTAGASGAGDHGKTLLQFIVYAGPNGDYVPVLYRADDVTKAQAAQLLVMMASQLLEESDG